MSNPAQVFVSTYAGTGSCGQSTFVTFSFANTLGFEAFIPVKVIIPNVGVSAGPEVHIVRSTDGGATYETERTIGMVFTRQTNATVVRDLTLRDPGQYLLCCLSGGGASGTWSFQVAATAYVISAYA